MRASIYLFAIFLCLHMDGALGAPFSDGNTAFDSGRYEEAVERYERDLKENGPSAAAYYNLGNAYQRLERYGPAILAYERAKLITPRDPDLRVNLALARKAVSAFDPTEGNGMRDAFPAYFSRDEWAWILVAAAYLGAGIVFLVGWRGVKSRWLRRFAVAGFGISVLIVAASSTVLIQRGGESDLAVVVSKDAVLRLSPFGSAESVGSPGPGRSVKLGKREGDFRYVTVPGQGLVGWMAEGDYGTIVGD